MSRARLETCVVGATFRRSSLAKSAELVVAHRVLFDGSPPMSDPSPRATEPVSHALVITQLIDDLRARVCAMPPTDERRRFVAKLDAYAAVVLRWVGIPPSDAQRLAMFDRLVALLDEVRTATWMRTTADASRRARRGPAFVSRLVAPVDVRRTTVPFGVPVVSSGALAPVLPGDAAPAPSPSGIRRTSRVPPKPRGERPLPGGRVDVVGESAVRLAELVRRTGSGVPTVIADDRRLASAPLSSLEAFVISRIDGHVTVSALAEMLGLGVARLHAMLERLARLGLVAL